MSEQKIWEIAERKAEKFLEERGINLLPVDPFSIAKSMDIEVQAKPSDIEGVSGMLIRLNDIFGIMYSTNISNEGFQRFSVSHELGHYLLEGHFEHLFPDGDGVHESRCGFVSDNRYEKEADYFAVGLLMPRNLFRNEMRLAESGLKGIETLAEKCNTSLTSTAIRYIQRIDLPEAVVMSTGNIIDYCFMSDEFKQLGKFDWLRKGEPLPKGTTTFNFNQNQENIINANRKEIQTELTDWFKIDRKLEIEEQIIGLGNYGKTLTVITVSEDYEDDEDDDSNWSRRIRK